jgi:hypothetical protein
MATDIDILTFLFFLRAALPMGLPQVAMLIFKEYQ